MPLEGRQVGVARLACLWHRLLFPSSRIEAVCPLVLRHRPQGHHVAEGPAPTDHLPTDEVDPFRVRFATKGADEVASAGLGTGSVNTDLFSYRASSGVAASRVRCPASRPLKFRIATSAHWGHRGVQNHFSLRQPLLRRPELLTTSS